MHDILSCRIFYRRDSVILLIRQIIFHLALLIRQIIFHLAFGINLLTVIIDGVWRLIKFVVGIRILSTNISQLDIFGVNDSFFDT